jgi:hypothetical protein
MRFVRFARFRWLRGGAGQGQHDESAVDARPNFDEESRKALARTDIHILGDEVTLHRRGPVVFVTHGTLDMAFHGRFSSAHGTEPNRSGGERQGSLSGEPTSELREDCQVGVESDPIQPSDAERPQRPIAEDFSTLLACGRARTARARRRPFAGVLRCLSASVRRSERPRSAHGSAQTIRFGTEVCIAHRIRLRAWSHDLPAGRRRGRIGPDFSGEISSSAPLGWELPSLCLRSPTFRGAPWRR